MGPKSFSGSVFNKTRSFCRTLVFGIAVYVGWVGQQFWAVRKTLGSVEPYRLQRALKGGIWLYQKSVGEHLGLVDKHVHFRLDNSVKGSKFDQDFGFR